MENNTAENYNKSMKEKLQSIPGKIKTHRKILIILGIVLLVILIAVFIISILFRPQNQEYQFPTPENPVSIENINESLPPASLYFEPQALDVTQGETYTAHVGVDVQNTPSNGVELILLWNPEEIGEVTVQEYKDNSSALSNSIHQISLIEDAEAGIATLLLISDDTTPEQKGSGLIASVTFTALSDNPSTSLRISSKSQITNRENAPTQFDIIDLLLE